MSKDQKNDYSFIVENVDNFRIIPDYIALDKNFKLKLKNYYYVVYSEKMYKNFNTSISKKKFKTHNAAIRYYKRMRENPKVCLTYMGITASKTF